jgi:hypothetical protein
MAYPGNDPENGPATLRCQKDPDHESLDEVEEDVAEKAAPDIIDGFLKELTCGQRHTTLMTGPQYVAIPDAVRLAAHVLIQDLESQGEAEAQGAIKHLATRVGDLTVALSSRSHNG